jgi:adenine-specific DNA methylase
VSDRRLIEEELPLAAVNAQSAREKNVNHGHIASLHRWWARRPLAMSRAVVFGTLLPDPGDDAARREVLDQLALAAPFEAATDPMKIGPLRRMLADAYSDGPPKVLDCFAGGGAIPLEAARLGCDVTAVDLNPVAHLIERATLEFPQTYGDSLADDVVTWADWVRRHAEPALAEVFPADEAGRRPAVYFWARTMVCPNPSCRAAIPLITSRWLANSTRRKVWLDLDVRPGAIDIAVRTTTPPDGLDLSTGSVKASSVTCPACGTTTPAADVRAYGKTTGFGARLLAVLDVHDRARTYREPRRDEVDGAQRLAAEKLADLGDCPDSTSAVPDEPMVKSQYRRYGNLVYGIDTFAGLFNDRQRYALSRLATSVRAAHEQMLADGMAKDRATAVTTYLGFLVDKMAEHDSAFTSWQATGREASRGTFPRQAIAMVWDYVETDPFQENGIWDAHTRWVELVVRHCAALPMPESDVCRGDAQALGFDDCSFDAVIVDPPYYDAVQYGDLSDFFYVWLKRSIGHLYSALFSTPLTPKTAEVIESRADRKSAEYISHDEFDRRLQAALDEMARVVKPDGVVSIVFAHTDVEAWERLLRALRNAGLVVSTSWPMRSEREARSTAQISAVLGSSVVLVCRKQDARTEGFYDDVVRALEARIAERLDAFEEMGLVGADYFVSAIGPAFEVFASYSKIVKLSGDEVDVDELMVLARQTVATHAMRRLLGADSLAALDAESLFYLTWRWAYLSAAVPADEAYKLERAFDVDLGRLIGPSGIARRSGSNFSLLGPHERRKIRISAAPPLIDVLHLACQLHDAGRRGELADLLGATGAGTEPAFWSLARALAETLPDRDRERTMLLGLTGNRDALTAAAARATVTVEELPFADVPS